MLRRKIQFFEIAILILLTTQLAYEYIYLNIWDQRTLIFEGIFFLLFALKFLFEGMRTESLIALLTELHIIMTKIVNMDFFLLNSLPLFFFFIYLFFIAMFPFYEYPKTSGKFKVGYKYFPLASGVNCSVFYPTEQSTRRAYWLTSKEYFENLFEESPFRFVIRFVSTFYLKIKMNVNENAAFLSDLKKIGREQVPVIVFEHDLNEHSNTYSRLLGDLSSQGFIVFSIDHSRSEIQDVNEIKQIKQTESLMKQKWLTAQKRLQRLNMLRDFILDEDKIRGFFKSPNLSIERNALIFGAHGFGACALHAFVSKLSEVSCLLLIDPDFDGLPKENLTQDLRLPILCICSSIYGQISELNSFFIDYIRRFYAAHTTLWESNRNMREKNIFLTLNGSTHVFPVDWVLFRAREYALASWIKSKKRVEDYLRFDRCLIKSFLEEFLPGKIGKGEFYDNFIRSWVIPFRLNDILDLKSFESS